MASTSQLMESFIEQHETLVAAHGRYSNLRKKHDELVQSLTYSGKTTPKSVDQIVESNSELQKATGEVNRLSASLEKIEYELKSRLLLLPKGSKVCYTAGSFDEKSYHVFINDQENVEFNALK